jgi:hypothetical protein
MAEDEGTKDAAAEAFAQLCGEVLRLRGAVEAVCEQQKDGPDYTLTLAAIAQTLKQIERHPSLQRTPEQFRAENTETLAAVRRQFEGEIQSALAMIVQAARDFRDAGGALRSRKEQREAVLYGGAGGLIGGVALFALLSGPAVRALPTSWQVPERVAAATLHMDMGAAGARLMQDANPQGWENLAEAARLRRDNAAALDSCARSVAKAGRAQACKIMVGAD